ncbi:MAG: hypothetical protein CL840_11915 [Crocinitomicaceae bacterium]|nr:hypothetical protein [Crocinitomicaceae bacterium]|tara:strand:- start:6311 stop:6679 length:369 start_codon:yes stop_codon:yes gene_type:complete
MELDTCFKYLEFVHAECERHLADGVVEDDELFQLIIEFNRFQEHIKRSDLPEELKSKIAKVEFNYTRKKVKRNAVYMLLAFVTVGTWAYVAMLRQQRNRIRTLEDIKHDMNSLSMHMRMNYT